MVLYYSTMVTTHAGHAKMRSAELSASARQYQHPPSYDHDVDNIGLTFEELKQRQIEQALQQCQDRNGPLAKAMIDTIENPPPPFESMMTMMTMTTRPVMRLKRKKTKTRINQANMPLRIFK